MDGVDIKRLTVHSVDLNDGHFMVVDGEDMICVARNGNQTETVTRNRIFSAT